MHADDGIVNLTIIVF